MAAITWSGAVAGAFTDASDWVGDTVPGATDDAVLDASGAAFAVNVASSETVNSIQTTSNATLALGEGSGTFTATNGTGTGVNAGAITVGDKAILKVGGTFDNSGSISLTGSELEVATGGVTLTGGGAVTMANDTIGGVGRITSHAASTTLTNFDNTISGEGIILMSLSNEAAGVIDASGSAALNLGKDAVTNAGLVEATGSGGLNFGATTIANAGGTISAGAGSKVSLAGTHIKGGTLATSGKGVIRTTTGSSELDGTATAVDVTGTVVVLAGSTLTTAGTIDVSGKIVAKGAATLDGTIDATSTSLFIVGGGTMSFGSSFSSTVAFNGAGTLSLSDSVGFDATVCRFDAHGSDALDLEDIDFSASTKATFSGTASGGVLTVTDGTHTAKIKLRGDYLTSTFTVASDGHGGSTLTESTPAAAAAPALAQAMAGFTSAPASTSAGYALTALNTHGAPMLALPSGSFG